MAESVKISRITPYKTYAIAWPVVAGSGCVVKSVPGEQLKNGLRNRVAADGFYKLAL